MPDNKNNRGARDRARVSGSEQWEIDHMKTKFNVSGQQVAGAIRAVGNSRKKVEEYLRNRSK